MKGVCPPATEYSERPQVERWVEKVPYERKVIEFEEYEYEEEVPVEVSRIEYEEVKRIEYVPVERKVTDYYVVEITKALIPQVKPELKKEIVPVEREVQKVVYKPVTRQIIRREDDRPGADSQAKLRVTAQDYEKVLAKLGLAEEANLNGFLQLMRRTLG
jgi:hypothetical protein